MKTLAEVCQIKPPKTEARCRVSETSLVSFVPMEDLGVDQKFIKPSRTKPLGEVVGSYTYFANGDVLLAKITPCFENGKLGIAADLTNGIGFGSSEYIVFRADETLDREWLYYYLSREDFRIEGAQRMSGAVGHKRVAKEFIESYLIPLPTLPDQRRIVSILDEAFDGIATAKANAEKNLESARALFESYLKTVFTEQREEWVERKLGDKTLVEIIDGDRGTNYPKTSDFHDDGYCLFLNTKNVRPDGFEFDSTMFITKEKDDQLRKGKLKRNDVVMTTRGTIGNIGLYSEEIEFENIRINSGMLIFRVNQKQVLPSFLFEMLRSHIMKVQIKKHTSGAAQPQLPIKTLVNFIIPIPVNLEKQQSIVSTVNTLFRETQCLESIYRRKLEALDELKKSLLHKAFSGEL